MDQVARHALMLLLLVAFGRRGHSRVKRPPPEHWPQGTDNLGTLPLPKETPR